MSRLSDTIAKFRKDLLNHERTAMASLDYAHRQTLARIEPMLNDLYDKMSAAIANGEDISKSWLYEANRLQFITQYIEQTINNFGNLTQSQVTMLQHSASQLGQQSGMALLNSVTPAGVNFAFGVPSQQAIANLVGATQAGSPLADLFAGFGAEAAQGAKNALITGVTLGYGPRQIAVGIQDALNISRNRALTIARDQSVRAYRSANLETFQANSDVVGQWRWTCALSARTCAACLAEDGTLHDLDEEMDSHTCCRCTPVPVTKSWDDILGPLGIDTSDLEDANPVDDMTSGADWFAQQDEATQQQILGPGGYALYQQGATLQDFVGTSHDATWGNSVYVKSNKQVAKAIA